MDTLVIRTDGTLEEHEIASWGSFAPFSALLGCRLIEPVQIPGSEHGALLCDEEGLLCDRPQINPIASFMAGHPIAGDVAVVGELPESYGPVNAGDAEFARLIRDRMPR